MHTGDTETRAMLEKSTHGTGKPVIHNSSMKGFHRLNRFQNISQHEGRPYKLELPAKIWGQAGTANKMLILTI